MDQSLDKKIEAKEKVLNFLKKNKFRLFILFLILIVFLTSFFLVKYLNKKENILTSENYIKGGILLADNQNDEAKKYFEKIVETGDNFYSLLALNTILEKNLITDQKKVLQYFERLENKKFSRELADLILFKKALYLLKINDKESGIEILSNLIKKESKLKILAQEIISK
tara:strand:+ start:540 stop:1049 length:510 start_codon:yes stop_codon:yes gene_type:complete